jgi:general secretion pathway protein J
MKQWQVASGKWQGKAGSPTQGGFTLLELLVALSVFAFVSVMAYGGLRVVLDTRGHTDQASRDLGELQVALTLLSRDLAHVVARPVRDVHGDPQAPLRFNAYSDRPRLEVVRTSSRSGLQRVAWEIDETRLYRMYWTALDGADPAEPQGRLPVMGPVEDAERTARGVEDWSLRFHYHLPDGTFGTSESWPLEINPGALDALPVALELTLALDGRGTVTRWLAVQ